MDDNRPKRIKATTMDSRVSEVRSFLRLRLLQRRGRNFTGKNGRVEKWNGGMMEQRKDGRVKGSCSLHRFVGELAFVEIDGAGGAGGSVGIMGDHDDGFAMLAIERLEQIEYLVARLAVEIA